MPPPHDDEVMRVLACSAAFAVLLSMAPTHLNYLRRNRLMFGTTAGAAGLQALLLFALVPSLGATGASIVYAVAMVGMHAVFVIAAHPEWVVLRARQRRLAGGDANAGR